MEVINYLLIKEREFVSQYMDTTNMTDEEIDENFDLIVQKIINEYIGGKKRGKWYEEYNKY